MRKVLVISALLLLPSALWAQGALRVTSVVPPVEWRAASSKTFTPLTTTTAVIQVGDEVRTGSGGSVILTAPDASYMVVSENSKVVVDDFWSGSFRSIVNVMLGQVRFYIQRLGGRPNPYSVRTPTALIAVRGTIFSVDVDPAQIIEVSCFEGQVNVQNLLLPDREVLVNPGFHTLVRPGEIPMMPVRDRADLRKPRTIEMRKVTAPESDTAGTPSIEILPHSNDRQNRPSDPVFGNSRTNGDTQRTKPTLSFPQ
jgi:hypothetical protein